MEAIIFIKVIFENAPIGILRTNQAGDILMANQKIASILGYESTQKMFEKVINVVDIYARKSDREWVLEKIEKKHEIDIELDAITKDKRIIRIHCIVKAEKDLENDQIYFMAFITDVTENYSMLKQIMKRGLMLNSIINCLPFELVVSDRKGYVLVQNDLSKNIVGDQIGKNMLRLLDISDSNKQSNTTIADIHMLLSQLLSEPFNPY